MIFGICAVVAGCYTLAACGPDDHARPGDRLTLTFTGKSHSEYFFALENPTSYPIYFRGIESLWLATIPVDVAFDCINEKTLEGTVGGFPLFDGGKDPPTIAVLPGKAVKLRVESLASGFRLGEHKGETCKMRLGLWPDTPRRSPDSVESQGFQV